jgi:superfamily II DNA helicase RecQ
MGDTAVLGSKEKFAGCANWFRKVAMLRLASLSNGRSLRRRFPIDFSYSGTLRLQPHGGIMRRGYHKIISNFVIFPHLQDQLRSLPPRIPAATLSGSVSASATAAILDDVIRKRIKILFVSPERLTSPSFRRLFYTKWNPETQQQERRFPEISLLCVDEAHCVSQWAHNFRPCFLRFRGLLHLMKPQSILAVTATAGPRVIEDISKTLGIQSEAPAENSSLAEDDNILVIDKSRDNIDVSCEFVANHAERLEMVRNPRNQCLENTPSNII